MKDYRRDIAANVSRIPGAMVVKCYSEEEARTEFVNAVEDGIAQKVSVVERSRFLYMSALDSLPMGEIRMFSIAKPSGSQTSD